MSKESMKDENVVYQQLAAPFPDEAYSIDSSRGFDLTSLKAQYATERLNEVVGIMNWTFDSEYKETDGGILCFGTLKITVNGKQNTISAPGFSSNKKNLGDAYKGANTDSLKKCASRIGIGNEAHKGMIKPKSNSGPQPIPYKMRTKPQIKTVNEVVEDDDI